MTPVLACCMRRTSVLLVVVLRTALPERATVLPAEAAVLQAGLDVAGVLRSCGRIRRGRRCCYRRLSGLLQKFAGVATGG
jgi:hypothetical protein